MDKTERAEAIAPAPKLETQSKDIILNLIEQNIDVLMLVLYFVVSIFSIRIL